MKVTAGFIFRTSVPALRFLRVWDAKALLKLALFAILAFILGSGFSRCVATEWYVAASVGTSGSGKRWETAFKTIQEGIDAASDRDTVLVAEGTYSETVRFKGKNICLQSTNPLRSEVVARTIIDGGGAERVVTFDGTESEACVLAGFTIKNGRWYGIYGGYEKQARAAIRNNVITENSGPDSAGALVNCGGTIRENSITANEGCGLSNCDGTIQNNTIAANRGYWHGGLAGCDGIIQNNTIIENRASRLGGGLFRCAGTIQGNVISRNSAGDGGGLAECGGSIRNNVITENSARGGGYQDGVGGGLAYCHGTIETNTIARNTAKKAGGGLYRCDGIVQGNAVTENSAEDYGGGFHWCDGIIQNNKVSGNSSANGGGLSVCRGTLQNNLIEGNAAGEEGGGIWECNGEILGNTIAGNSAGQRGGGLSQCRGIIRNCVIWANASGASEAQMDESRIPCFSCIEGWVSGGHGNINDNPLFVAPEAGDYRLSEGSPCRDAGANGYWFGWPQRDMDGNCRLAGDGVDMSCYEYGSSPDADGDLLSDENELALRTELFGEDTDSDGLRDGLEVLRGSDPLAPTEPGILRVPSDVPTIQWALCMAVSGDEVVMSPGTYYENLRFGGVNVVLRSLEPENAAVVAATIVDGSRAGPVVWFTGRESEECIVAGFTITNGEARYGGGVCGCMSYDQTHATIRNSVIRGNSAPQFTDKDTSGAGLYCCDGPIEDNTICDNFAGGRGGGLAGCDGPILRNVIARNSAFQGGGLENCRGIIQNNRITDNSAADVGGGLSQCGATIRNNVIYRNSARHQGGGTYRCYGTIENNTIYANSAELDGGICTAREIRNCIIWGNRGQEDPSSYGIPSYCCIERWTGGGEGNISSYPHFVDAANGDFHLKSWSPCIDAGDPSSPFAEEPDPNGGRIDMGAYGNTPEATPRSPDGDQDGLPDHWEMEFLSDLTWASSDDPDGDELSNMEEYERGFSPTVVQQRVWYVDGSVPQSGDGTSSETAFKSIQEGLDAASDSETVIVAQGTYVENIAFNGKNITVQSKDPLSFAAVVSTIIDGNQEGAVVSFGGAETEKCVLAGFTIRNGKTDLAGGGIRGGRLGEGTHATIANNVITSNASGESGGGLAYCDGVVRNSLVMWNSSVGGGGLAYCSGSIRSSLISGNAAGSGGGLWESDAVLENNTITDNWAEKGGGLHSCFGTISNCIIWGNRAEYLGGHGICSEPTCSCIEDWEYGGVGNISENPRFADAAYHLAQDSPCIDAGKNEDWMWSAVDLDGNPRIFYGGSSKSVDMGAYEYGSWPLKVVEIRGLGGGGALLTWTSRPGDIYTVWSCLELFPAQWTEEITLPSGGETTIWTEPDTSGARKFYRIELK